MVGEEVNVLPSALERAVRVFVWKEALWYAEFGDTSVGFDMSPSHVNRASACTN